LLRWQAVRRVPPLDGEFRVTLEMIHGSAWLESLAA
jgi:hypothetical protein